MPSKTTQIAATSAAVSVRKQHKKSRLVTLESLDQRTTAARRVKEVVGALESDLGGSEHLSTAQRILVQRIAVQAAIIESSEASWARGESVDVASYTTMVNALRRNLETIGLKRIARDETLTLAEYLRSKEAEAGDVDEADVIEADQ